jgi:hypothetical protein
MRQFKLGTMYVMTEMREPHQQKDAALKAAAVHKNPKTGDGGSIAPRVIKLFPL